MFVDVNVERVVGRAVVSLPHFGLGKPHLIERLFREAIAPEGERFRITECAVERLYAPDLSPDIGGGPNVT